MMLRASFSCLLVAGGLVASLHAHAAGRGAELTLMAGGFDTLSNAIPSPFDPERVYVVEQYTGQIRWVGARGVADAVFLDVGERLIEDANFEEGLLGLAFPPDDLSTAYVSYVGRSGELVLSRFAVDDDGRRADPASEEILLRVARDYRMHQCGHLAFGPHDGLLYLCVGDTRDNSDITPVAQDLLRPQGKILRIDPAARPPATPPERGLIASASATAAAGVRPEIWLHGLRNPWRFSFDPDGSRIFIPDVGRRHWEELNVLATARPDGNFGWPLAEAGECLVDCTEHDDLIWPAFEYTHLDERCSIIGGAVYRGDRRPAWRGAFIFADLCSGEFWAWREGEGGPEVRTILDSERTPVAVLTDAAGELLVADGPNGSLWRLDLPEDADEGWRPARTVMAEAAFDARRDGFARTRDLLETAREDIYYMTQSPRWRMMEPLVRFYDWLGRPLED